MPLIKVQTSIANPEAAQVEGLLKTLSGKLAQHLGKPESYVMTAFEAGVPMTFGGTTDPVCYLEVKSIGSMSASQTKTMSQDFCAELASTLGVDQNRIYIEFADAKATMWGWNGDTFG
jgi:phenylpyruvate tautomerase PptA (4-oxalocrotonate tautomerase family)